MRKLKFFTTVATVLFLFSATSFAQTSASVAPPVANPPQFIVIGSDDNTRDDGFLWMANAVSEGTNYDGSPRYMSFYVNTNSRWTGANTSLRDAALEAYGLGIRSEITRMRTLVLWVGRIGLRPKREVILTITL